MKIIPHAKQSDVNRFHLVSYTGFDPYIFISYSHKDDIVQNILKEFAKNEVRFWFDEGIKTGAKWVKEIAQRINACEHFLVFVSANAMESEHVKNEISYAIKRDKDIIVIHLDDTEFDDELEYQLGRIQSICKSSFHSDKEFCEKLLRSINPITVAKSNEVTDAFEQIQQRYTFLQELSTSAYSTSHLAQNKKTDAYVFIKHFSFNNSYMGCRTQEVVDNEIAVLKHLHNCPFTSHLIDYYRDSNNAYILQNFIDGISLEAALKQKGHFDLDTSIEIICDILEALCYFHTNEPQIAHLDLKPKNIIIPYIGHTCIIDFGISKLISTQRQYPYLSMVLGTKGYAAPEQHDNHSDTRSDIFSLGVMFFQMITGQTPHWLSNQQHGYHLSAYAENIPEPIERIVLKMTATNPQERYQTPMELLFELRNYKGIGRIFDKYAKGYMGLVDLANAVPSESKTFEVSGNTMPGELYYDTFTAPITETVSTSVLWSNMDNLDPVTASLNTVVLDND